jgi:uncharacterized protein YndB with AHSA1/START domain
MAERLGELKKAAAQQPQPLQLSRVLHAPRATVFRAWTSTAHVRQWFCPDTFVIPAAEVELRVGGRFDVCMRSPAGDEHWIRGRFVEITPHTRLIIDMYCADSAGRQLFRAYTEVDFADALGGTRLDVLQTYTLIDPASGWMVAGAPDGWRTTLDRLEKQLLLMQGGAESSARSVVHAEFTLERSYPAPVAQVWKAFTDEAAKQRWFSGTPGSWELLERRMDVRVGGSERLRGRWQGGAVSTFDAVYHDVIPNERLLYSYTMHLDDRKISVSLATVELRSAGGKTTVKVTEQGAFLDGYEDGGSRERGTGHLLDALGESLAN